MMYIICNIGYDSFACDLAETTATGGFRLRDCELVVPRYSVPRYRWRQVENEAILIGRLLQNG